MKRLMDTTFRGYSYFRKGLRFLNTLPYLVFKGGTATKDFMIQQNPNDTLTFSKSNDNAALNNLLTLDWNNTLATFEENTLFKKYITTYSKILWDTENDVNRNGKNFEIQALNWGGVGTNNGLFFRKMNGTNFVSSLMFFDWDTGKVTHYTEVDFNAVTVHTPMAAPAPVRGGMYFDSTANKFKVCEDGSTWVNIV